jgi:hypothetical protein
MKVLCIDDNKCSLTIGKWYDVGDKNLSTLYDIVNDKGVDWAYPKFQFKTTDELREDKLKELGI